MAIWNTSLRFFSPPENPSFTERPVRVASISTRFFFSRMSLRKSAEFMGGCPLYLRWAFTAARRKLTMETPGISTGY